MGERVVVTGGAGFIGSHLAEALLDDGHTVYALDDLSTGSIDNISHLKGHPNFHYTIDTVFNDPLLRRAASPNTNEFTHSLDTPTKAPDSQRHPARNRPATAR